MRYESESRTWGIAARAISERIRAMPEFAEARQLVIDGAAAECGDASVPTMRALGGFSAVIERQIKALPDRFHAPVGSKLLPATVASELQLPGLDLVNAVKARLREIGAPGAQWVSP
jgi:hypothetical protein